MSIRKKLNSGVILVLLIAVIAVVGYLRFAKQNVSNINSPGNNQIINVTPTDIQQLTDIQKIKLINDTKEVKLSVEVAKTPEEQRIGLMNRKSLDMNKGMIFVFEREKQQSFWMKDTYIPLDIIFFDARMKFVSVSKNAQPCVDKGYDCPGYESKSAAKYVLETNVGAVSEDILDGSLRFEGIR